VKGAWLQGFRDMDLNPDPINLPFPRKDCIISHGKKKKEDFGEFMEELFLVRFGEAASFKGLRKPLRKTFFGWQYS